MSSTLESNAMLCRVAIHMWHNESKDNESAQELAESNKVEVYAKVKRIHLPEYCLDRIRSVAGSIRLFHAANTLPFLDRGFRLLPSDNYFEFVQGLSQRQTAFDSAVDEFITQLPVYIAEAKQKFGSKFDETYIPSVEALRKKFYIESVFMPIAHPNDWRIQLEQKTIDNLKSQYASELSKIQQAAVAHLWEALEEGVSHFITKLETPKARLHETLVPNLLSRAQTIARLNTTNDPNITAVCTDIINCIDGIDTYSVKVDDLLKQEVCSVFKGILERINAAKPT